MYGEFWKSPGKSSERSDIIRSSQPKWKTGPAHNDFVCLVKISIHDSYFMNLLSPLPLLTWKVFNSKWLYISFLFMIAAVRRTIFKASGILNMIRVSSWAGMEVADDDQSDDLDKSLFVSTSIYAAPMFHGMLKLLWSNGALLSKYDHGSNLSKVWQ